MNTPVSSHKRSSGPSPVLIVGIVVAVVVIAAVIAVVVAGGGSGGGSDSSTRVSTVPVDDSELDPRIPEVLRREVRPVEVIGTPLPPFVAGAPDPAIGTVPPVLIGEDGTGYVHTISPDIDGPVLLVFLAHWCPACNQELPQLVQLAEQGVFPENLKIYAVLTAIDPSRPNFPPIDWLIGGGWPYDYVVDLPDMDLDGAWIAGDSFGLTSFPYMVLIDDGVVVDRWSGVSEPNELLARLAAVAA